MKSPYTFVHRDKDGNVLSVKHSYEITWPELFEEFRMFLSGCGFIVPLGEIIIEDTNTKEN